MVELEQRLFQKDESRNAKGVRPYIIDPTNEIVIELRGITDYKWTICKSLLDELRTTRKKTELGEVQITPMTYERVKKNFPKNTPRNTIYRTYQMLNKALSPSGWSIVRQGKTPRIPIDAPWFLRGPDDNGAQSKKQPEPKQKRIFDRTVGEERKRMALKQFDPLAFGTSLLHLCLSDFTNLDTNATFTKDPEQVMSSLLPKDLKLKDIIGGKTPQEYFQGIIKDAINSMAGKTYEELSEKQKPIMPLWNELRQSGQNPKTVIFEYFRSGTNTNALDKQKTT